MMRRSPGSSSRASQFLIDQSIDQRRGRRRGDPQAVGEFAAADAAALDDQHHRLELSHGQVQQQPRPLASTKLNFAQPADQPGQLRRAGSGRRLLAVPGAMARSLRLKTCDNVNSYKILKYRLHAQARVREVLLLVHFQIPHSLSRVPLPATAVARPGGAAACSPAGDGSVPLGAIAAREQSVHGRCADRHGDTGAHQAHRRATPSSVRSITTSACCWPSRTPKRPAASAGRRLSHLLPDVSGSVTESRRKTTSRRSASRCATDFPRVVGPFNVFDARLFASQTVFDLSAFKEISAASHRLAAAQAHLPQRARPRRAGRGQPVSAGAGDRGARRCRSGAARHGAGACISRRVSLRQSGIVAGLDVVRAEVRMSTDRQRATAAANDSEKAKLQLARVIGLPLGQPFTLGQRDPVRFRCPR